MFLLQYLIKSTIAFKTVNFNLTTSDNIRLGAWLVLSDEFYQAQTTSAPPTAQFTEAQIDQALSSHPTVIFLHGNAATRAVSFRVSSYSSITSRLGANVLAIDYRGFADSEGIPSPEGLARDARAAWDWLNERGASAEDVVLMGHSLGTGVASMLAAELAVEGMHLAPSTQDLIYLLNLLGVTPRGLVLVAPFTSISELLETYALAGLIPVLRPMRTFPWALS